MLFERANVFLNLHAKSFSWINLLCLNCFIAFLSCPDTMKRFCTHNPTRHTIIICKFPACLILHMNFIKGYFISSTKEKRKEAFDVHSPGCARCLEEFWEENCGHVWFIWLPRVKSMLSKWLLSSIFWGDYCFACFQIMCRYTCALIKHFQ